jgi:hypothetical protein
VVRTCKFSDTGIRASAEFEMQLLSNALTSMVYAEVLASLYTQLEGKVDKMDLHPNPN